MGAIISEPSAGSLSFPIKDFREKWVLYAHYIEPEPEVFYLGICRLIHLYDFSDAYRNTHWRKTVKETMVIKVGIIASMDNPIDANTALRTAYTQLRPEANVHGYVVTGKTVVTCLEGENKGTTYETAGECARLNGISPGALSNHLNGRIGYEAIKGMKFKRGMI